MSSKMQQWSVLPTVSQIGAFGCELYFGEKRAFPIGWSSGEDLSPCPEGGSPPCQLCTKELHKVLHVSHKFHGQCVTVRRTGVESLHHSHLVALACAANLRYEPCTCLGSVGLLGWLWFFASPVGYLPANKQNAVSSWTSCTESSLKGIHRPVSLLCLVFGSAPFAFYVLSGHEPDLLGFCGWLGFV